MRTAAELALVGLFLVAACGGDEDGASASRMVSSAAPSGQQIVIRTEIVVAATAGAEPIATGDILDGSMLGGSPFCAGGTIRDSHASRDPEIESLGLIDRMITCRDGSLRLVFAPEQPQGLSQKGSWTIVRGTDAFEGARGTGTMEVMYDPDDDSLARETLAGTVTR